MLKTDFRNISLQFQAKKKEGFVFCTPSHTQISADHMPTSTQQQDKNKIGQIGKYEDNHNPFHYGFR